MDMLDFLYHTIPGRMLLKPLTAPALSKLCGRFLDSSLSHFLVRPFIQTNNIRIEDYETDHIRSFNDFFSRKICEGLRPVDPDPKHLIAPCDGLLSVWKIEKDTVFPVKQSSYTLTSLLRSHKLARHYEGGYCLVFRLCVNHYHRYCYVDSGAKSRNRRIPGVLHTVRPVARREPSGIYREQPRIYTDPHGSAWNHCADGGRCNAGRSYRKPRRKRNGCPRQRKGLLPVRRLHDHTADGARKGSDRSCHFKELVNRQRNPGEAGRGDWTC